MLARNFKFLSYINTKFKITNSFYNNQRFKNNNMQTQ